MGTKELLRFGHVVMDIALQMGRCGAPLACLIAHPSGQKDKLFRIGGRQHEVTRIPPNDP